MKFDHLLAVLVLLSPLVLSSCASQQVEYRARKEYAYWEPGKVTVNYSLPARNAGAEGFVLVGYTILPDGSVAKPFLVRAAIHGEPRGKHFRNSLVRETLSAISRRTYTLTSDDFQPVEMDTVSLLKFQMPPITMDKDPCPTPKPATLFDPSEIQIRFGIITFDKWGNALLKKETAKAPFVPLREDSSILYGTHVDNPKCHTFTLNHRIDAAKNPWFRNKGEYFERRDELTGSLVFESPFQEINSRSGTGILVLRSDDLPGVRTIEIRVNDKPFKLIQVDVAE
jgi:hypothetical protein